MCGLKKDTACCIEGYPRCANTFAVVAFASAQPSTVTLAHHSHLAGQVLLAERRKLPILLLVRPPQDAIASLMVRDPHITPMMMLKDYERFHRALVPIIDNLLVADFDQVTGDFGLVIQRLNQKFNTRFVAFEHTPANVDKCVKQIEEIDRKCGGRKLVAESQVSRPSEDRKVMLNKCKIAISHKNNQTILRKCEALYNFYSEKRDCL